MADILTRDGLRRQLRSQRAALSARQIADAEAHFIDLCLPLLGDARHIAGYFAMGGELPVDAVLQHCRAGGAVSYVPVIAGEQLRFVPFDEHTPMQTGRFGIQVPDVAAGHAIDPLSLDVVLVPLVGFDTHCHRLGMGGGYYDRTFTVRREQAGPPRLIGCAHSFQRVDTVWPDWWDVSLDCVVTDTGVIHRPD